MLVIPQNFSDSLRSRIENGKDTPEWDVTHSVIDVYADKSSKFLFVRLYKIFNQIFCLDENIATFLTRDLLFGMENYSKNFLQECDINPKAFGRPVNVSYYLLSTQKHKCKKSFSSLEYQFTDTTNLTLLTLPLLVLF